MVTQALNSVSNFALNLYMLSTTAPEEFGLFGISFAIMVVLSGFWQSFFIAQYIVLAPSEDHAWFPAQVYVAMLIVSSVAVVLVISMAAALQPFTNVSDFVLGIGLSAIALSIKEFHVRSAFSMGRESHAVWVNGIMCIALMAFLGFASFFNLELGADIAFVAYAAIVLLAALAGQFLARFPFSGHTFAEISATMNKLSRGGKWAIATNVTFSIRNNAHIAVLAGLLGPTAVAKVNAARLFLTPLIQLLPALSNVILPSFSQALRNGDQAALRQSQKWSGAALLAVVLVYSAVLLSSWQFLEPLVMGDQYQGLAPLIASWCVFAATLVFRSIVDWGVQAQRRFALITKVSVGVAFFTLLATWFFTSALGPVGAILALAVSELLFVVTLLTATARRAR